MNHISSADLIEQHLDSSKFEAFLNDAEKANRAFNLYSRNLQRADLRILAAESLFPLHLKWITAESGPILDIGSGWGIPAIPFLLSGLSLDITFIERSQKKSDLVRLALSRLGLTAQVVTDDIVKFHSDVKYGIFTVRGVSIETRLLTQMKALSAVGGQLIYFGQAFPEEMIDSAEIYEYSIDNLPARKIIKCILI
jgi:16S rRNA (guanine527-N7)-methyltransferase